MQGLMNMLNILEQTSRDLISSCMILVDSCVIKDKHNFSIIKECWALS